MKLIPWPNDVPEDVRWKYYALYPKHYRIRIINFFINTWNWLCMTEVRVQK